MKPIYAAAFASAIAITAVAGAQTPTRQTPAAPAPAEAQTPAAGKVTVEGCLMREKDVPALKPNIVEKAGVTEDYVLTSSRVVKGDAPSSSTDRGQGAVAVGTAGNTTTPMYQVKGFSEDTLKPHIGHRVQIDGRLEDLHRAASSTRDADDLAEIDGTAIRRVSGDCAK